MTTKAYQDINDTQHIFKKNNYNEKKQKRINKLYTITIINVLEPIKRVFLN